MNAIKNSPSSPVRKIALIGALSALIVSPAVHAVTYDWTGATNNNLSGTPANWSPSLSSLGTSDVLRWNSSIYTGTAPTPIAALTFGELLFDAGNTNGITFGSGASALTLNGVSGTGILVNSGSGAVSTGSATFKLGAAQSWTNNSSNTLTVGGGITNQGFLLTLDGTGATSLGGSITGTGGVTVSAGTVTLSGTASTFTGGTTLTGGTLNLNSTKAVGAAASTFTINGGTIDNTSGGAITFANINPITFNGDFTFTGTNNLNLGTGAISLGTATGTSRTITTTAGTLTLGGVISNGTTANNITKAGEGTLTLTGANTFTGGLTLNAGTVNINSAGVASTSGPLGNGGTLTINGGTIDNTSGTAKVLLNVKPITVGGNFAFSTSGGTSLNNLSLPGAVTLTGNRTITTNGSGVLTLSGAVDDGGNGYSLTKDGAGSLTLSAADTFSGGLNILNGTTTLGNVSSAGTGAITLGDSSGSNSATLTLNSAGGTFANNITVAAGSSGALSITQPNITGTTVSGTVALNNNLSITAGNAGKVITFSNALTETSSTPLTISISNGYAAFTGGVALGAGGLVFDYNNTANAVTIGTGNVTGSGNLTLQANGAGTFTVSATSINNIGTITNSGTGSGATTISGVIGSNVTGLTQNSATSNLILTAANTSFAGGSTLNAGTLNLRNQNALQNSVLAMNGGTLTFGNSGALANVSLGGLSGSGNVNLNDTATTPAAVNLTVGNSNGQNASYSGALSNTNGSATLSKVGTNTQTLSGTNTYGGATTVSGGKLTIASTGSINGTSGVSIAGGEFNYNSSTALTKTITFAGTGGTLSGSGSISSAFTLTSGNTLSPGNSPGLLSTASQTWNNGGNYNWQVVNATGTAGADFDSVSITGNLDLGGLTTGGFNLNLWSLSDNTTNGLAINFNNAINQTWTLVSTSAGVTGFVASYFNINTGSINGTSGFTNALGGGVFSLAVGNGAKDLNLIFTAAPIPEPATYAVLFGAAALFGTIIYRRRRFN